MIDWSLIGMYLGLAITSAGVLWGVVFSVEGRMSREETSVWQMLSVEMLAPMLIGTVMLVCCWWCQLVATRTVVLTTQYTSVQEQYLPELQLLEIQFVPIVFLIIVALTGLWFIRKDRKKTWVEFEWMYVGMLLCTLAFLLMPLYAWEFGFAIERVLSVGSIGLGLGTAIVFSFLFFKNRQLAERMPFLYEILEPMCKVILVALAAFMLLFFVLSSGMVYVYPPFVLMQILFGLILIVTAFIAGPVLDSGVHAHAEFSQYKVQKPEAVIWSYLLFGFYLSLWMGFLVVNFYDLSAYTLRELVAWFFVFAGAILFIISFAGPLILSKDRLFLRRQNGKMPVHGTQGRN
ncbi:MAG: hypothetical protein WCT24_02950 [Patescibacteria group bacterium]